MVAAQNPNAQNMNSQNANSQCDVAGMASYAQCQTSAMIKENPGVAMLVVFGVGVGVGALIGEVIPMTSSKSSSFGSSIGNSFNSALRTSENAFERIGRQICDSLNIKF